MASGKPHPRGSGPIDSTTRKITINHPQIRCGTSDKHETNAEIISLHHLYTSVHLGTY